MHNCPPIFINIVNMLSVCKSASVKLKNDFSIFKVFLKMNSHFLLILKDWKGTLEKNPSYSSISLYFLTNAELIKNVGKFLNYSYKLKIYSVFKRTMSCVIV